jgi:hypothetical protein
VSTVASSPVSGELLADAGATYANGSTTTNATEYRAASGAWVFATGTNHWSRGLGYNIDGVGEPSTLIQQATMNVLGDMRVRPTTPTGGLTVDASGTPAVSRLTPGNGSTGVTVATNVTATFDKPIDPSTVSADTLTLADSGGGQVAATVTFDRAANTATLVPHAALRSGTTYTVTVSTGVKSWAGTPLAAAASSTFTTRPLTVTAESPAAGATNVGSVPTITAAFSAPLDSASVNDQTFTLAAAGGASIAGVALYDSATNTASFTPSQPLTNGSSYTATLTTEISDTDGAPLQAPASWTFAVAGCPCNLMSALTPTALGLPVQDGRTGAGPWSYELGTKIRVSSGAELTAIRYYKDGSETGTHVGTVWDANGAPLARVTFDSESASGWQEQVLPTALTLAAGATYVVSIGFNAFFVDTPSGLQAQLTSGPLTSVADGNDGVYAPQAGSFPTQSHNSSNYFVDAVVG